MTKPIRGAIPLTQRALDDVEIVLGDPKSPGPTVQFGSYKAYPKGKRSALTVLGDHLVKQGILSPGAH